MENSNETAVGFHGEAIEAIRDNATRLEAYLESCEANIARLTRELGNEKAIRQANETDIARLTEELGNEKAAQREAEEGRERAETLALDLEKKLAAASDERDKVLARAEELARAETQLAECRAELDALARQLKMEQAARTKAEGALRAIEARINVGYFADAIPPPSAKQPELEPQQPPEPVFDLFSPPEEPGDAAEATTPDLLPDEKPSLPPGQKAPAKHGALVKKVLAAVVGCAVLAAAAVAVVTGFSSKPVEAPAAPPEVIVPKTGELDVSVLYKLALKGKAPQEIPGANGKFVLVRQHFDEESFRKLLGEAGIAESESPAFAEWYRSSFPMPPDVAKAFSGGPDVPLPEARKKMADFATAAGAENLAGRLRALVSYDEPALWKIYAASSDGVASVKDLDPGNYLVMAAPPGAPESWQPITAKKEQAPNLVTVRIGESAKFALKLTDSASAVSGKVVDAESGKSLAKVALTLAGEAAGGKDKSIAVTSKENGAFAVDPQQIGYGEISISVTNLPKTYVTATSFQGKREPGVAFDPVTIQLSKKAPDKATKKSVLSGRVLNADGAPAPGFTIWKTTPDGSSSLARSGRDGTYEVELGTGTAKLYASGPGTARTETATIEVQAGENVTRDFVLPKCGRIVLTLVAPEGKLPERFEECSLSSPNRVATNPDMIEREGDTYVIPYLVSGSYDLRFRVAGFKPVGLPGLVIDKEGADRPVSVTLEAGG